MAALKAQDMESSSASPFSRQPYRQQFMMDMVLVRLERLCPSRMRTRTTRTTSNAGIIRVLKAMRKAPSV